MKRIEKIKNIRFLLQNNKNDRIIDSGHISWNQLTISSIISKEVR